MKKLKSILFASMFLLSSSLLAQEGTQQQEIAAAEGLPAIAPTPAKGGREKCMGMKMGMGDPMASKMGEMENMPHCKRKHSGEMGGKSCRSGKQACGGAAALERRVNELEKRLDLMQQLLQSQSR
jgi:hypothetical protein